MGVVGVEGLPYYAYRRYPFGAQQRVPAVYNPSSPGRWSGDYNPYYDTSSYGGNSAPVFVVEAPFTREADLVRKRKLGEDISSSAGHNARNISLGNVSKSSAATSSSKLVRSPVVSSTPATRLSAVGQDNAATEAKHSSPSASEKRSSRPRVISIPVMSAGDGSSDKSVKCTVIPPQAGPKKSRKVMMTAEGAAVLIQSSFRGFQVRKTVPLAQLRHIAKVKSQLMELDAKVSDVDFINYARENSAARAKLTEEIMKLLLQLDAIQGAHPVVRDIRKLATKAVVGLQERVDALLLSTEVAAIVQASSHLPMEIEEASQAYVDRKTPTAAKESASSDSVTTAFVNIDNKDEPRGSDTNVIDAKATAEISQNTEGGAENVKNDCDLPTQRAQPDSAQAYAEVGSAEGDNIDDKDEPRISATDAKADVFRNTEEGAENVKNDCHSPTQDSAQDNGEVGSADGDHEERQFEASTAPVVKTGGTHVNLSMSMVEPDPDQDNGDVDTVQSSVEPMDVETVKGDIVKVNKSAADEVERVGLERDQPKEALHGRKDSVVRIEDDDGAKLDEDVVGSAHVGTLPESVDVTTVEAAADTLRLITRDERPVQSDNSSEASPPQESLQVYEEERREGIDDDVINDYALRTTDDLSEPDDDGDMFQSSNAKESSRPYSPRSPFETLDYLDFPVSVSDGELQLESPELLAQGEADTRTLLLKLSEENKALKSLLVTVMKWNQSQATAIQTVNQRLGKLESSLSPRNGKNGKKKTNSRRKEGKSSRMMF